MALPASPDAALADDITRWREPDPGREARQNRAQTDGKALRLLVVAGDAVNRRLAVRLLENMGHTVIGVAHGGEALAALERDHFDAVLLDAELLDMSSPEVADRIRERQGQAHVPIILLTSEEGTPSAHPAVDMYLPKPPDWASLKNAFEQIMSRRA